ncbi:3-oxoacyl-ACP synthase III family protein [Streptomyces sp. NPDC102437]|uniref:3-oxoacyl-ACP synthase III family protein n=1 Tax=Streptomyces sp. NPDC102437 TaxID=3366175 RepID=UPI00381AB776
MTPGAHEHLRKDRDGDPGHPYTLGRKRSSRPAIDNSALARRFGMDALWEQWVDAFIGTRSRHLAIDLDSGELAVSLAELAAEAGSRALAAAGLEPGEIDVLVMGTATPDQLMPATVNLVADRLGINDVPTYQLQSGCCGAVQALDVGRRMLQSAGHTNALVLGGDVCAQFFDLDADLMSLRPEELVNAVLFGDGAGAAVLTTEPAPGRPVIRRVLNRLIGLGQQPGQVLRWYGPAQGKPPEGAGVAEDYKAIEERVPTKPAGRGGTRTATAPRTAGSDKSPGEYLGAASWPPAGTTEVPVEELYAQGRVGLADGQQSAPRERGSGHRATLCECGSSVRPYPRGNRRPVSDLTVWGT